MDNDRIKIIKEIMPSAESKGVTIVLHNKMVSEYEDIINKVTAKTLDKLSAYATDIEKSEEIAKAVVARLFGEGE